MPPIEVPGHLSFPSGHATQAYLIAWTLAQVMPKAVWAPIVNGVPNGPLFRLAERIARNREVLGLHYPSDSEAGRILARAAAKQFVNNLPQVAGTDGMNTVNLLAVARAEWQVSVVPPPL